MKSRTTIADLAREVGVSKTAVSFAFNAPERLAAATLKRILEKADELGYVPDPLAQRLARGSQGNLGVLVPESLSKAFVHPHFQEVFQGVGAFCERRHLSMTIVPALSEGLVAAVRTAAVDGVITLGFRPNQPFLEVVQRRRLPLVTVDSRVDSAISSVTFQDQVAARDLLSRVLARGFRRIHVLTTPGCLTRRIKGLREALAQSGDQAPVVTWGVSEASAQSARRSLLAESWVGRPPEAVVCLSDAQAAGAYEYAEARGLRIPEDLSVTGFDGNVVLRHLRPVLTTVVQSGFLKGRLSAELVDDLWQGRPARHLVVKPRYVAGDSLGIPGTVG